MSIFDKILKKNNTELSSLKNFADEDIVAIADGEICDVKTIKDPMFAEEVLGKTIAFKFEGTNVSICSPANGKLTMLFPTGHAFGITMNNGVELLIHCGIDTVEAKGDGFKLLKKQDDIVKASEPIIEINYDKLSKHYDMTTMLIVVNANGKNISFIKPKDIKKGDLIVENCN